MSELPGCRLPHTSLQQLLQSKLAVSLTPTGKAKEMVTVAGSKPQGDGVTLLHVAPHHVTLEQAPRWLSRFWWGQRYLVVVQRCKSRVPAGYNSAFQRTQQRDATAEAAQCLPAWGEGKKRRKNSFGVDLHWSEMSSALLRLFPTTIFYHCLLEVIMSVCF